jgi:hypothetical protein
MEKGIKNLQTDPYIRETTCKVSLKVVEDINGQTDKFMKASGKMGLKMVQGYGEDRKEILT